MIWDKSVRAKNQTHRQTAKHSSNGNWRISKIRSVKYIGEEEYRRISD